jgi:hypothetical protein
MFLPIQRARTHVADIEGIDPLHMGIVDSGPNGLGRQILEGFLPVLGNRGLTYSDNGYVSHVSLE